MSIVDRIQEITRRNFTEGKFGPDIPEPEKPVKKEPFDEARERARQKAIQNRKKAKKAIEKLDPDYLDQFAQTAGVSEAEKLRLELVNDVMKYDLNAEI